MKRSYHVYASAKPGVAADEFEARMKEFLETQIADNHLCAYRIIRYDSSVDREEKPEYHVICDYLSADDLNEGLKGMRPDRWKQDPHAGMMEMVGTFRVAFSEDVSRSDI